MDFGQILNQFAENFITLFSVVNALSVMPVFLALTRDNSNQERMAQLRTAIFYFTGIILFFFFAGSFMLDFFGLGIPAIRIAGGFIILKSGVELLNSRQKTTLTDKSFQAGVKKENIALSPLALPLLAGPGGMAASISIGAHMWEAETSSDMFEEMIAGMFAVIVVALSSYAILRASQFAVPVLGANGMETLCKVMGFLVMAIGVQYITNGVIAIFGDIIVNALEQAGKS